MKRLFDFTLSGSEATWQAVDDRVMGGQSLSTMRPHAEQGVAFAGFMTREGGGGFASVQSPLPGALPADCVAIRLRCSGDGRSYSLRLRQQDAYDGISYRCDFRPATGVWQDVVLALADFRATFRGRELTSAAALQAHRVQRIGLLLAGGQTGEFELRLLHIDALDRAGVATAESELTN